MYRHTSTYSAYATRGLGSLHGRKLDAPKPRMTADLVKRVLSACVRVDRISPVGEIARTRFDELVPRGLRMQMKSHLGLTAYVEGVYRFCARSREELALLQEPT